MSMFNWSSSKSSNTDGSAVGEDSSVSNKFWIYWAVTIPLTLLVMIIWRVWWLHQERVNDEAVNEAVNTMGREGDKHLDA